MIRLEGVRYKYSNGPEAIRGVTLEIGKGEFVGIIGHSGAGKTTLAKLVAGLLKPTQGAFWSTASIRATYHLRRSPERSAMCSRTRR